jgi:hypothetical protein
VVEEGVRSGSEEWYNAAVRDGKIKRQERPGTETQNKTASRICEVWSVQDIGLC